MLSYLSIVSEMQPGSGLDSKKSEPDWQYFSAVTPLLPIRLGELSFLGRAAERGSRAFATRNRLRHGVEITSADFVLVLGRAVTIGRGREFSFL